MSKPPVKLRDLSVDEQLKLIEVIWDNVSRTPASVPLTAAQREELDRRLDDLEAEGPTGVSLEAIIERLHGARP